MSSSSSSTGQIAHYRRDIDGLRAVAIILVVLYHVGLAGFDGGFIGVDVFFVISGYLIIGMLERERSTSGRIDWPAFFLRRVKRLLPLALLVIAATLAASAFIMAPFGELQGMAKSALASLSFVLNLYLASSDVGYSSQIAETQPLTHFWSLGVEEQFYAFVPLVFLAAAALQRRGIAHGLARLLILGISCSLATLWLTEPALAFYWPWTRAYELLLGGLVAVTLTQSRAAVIAMPSSLVGLALLVFCVATFNPAQPLTVLQQVMPASAAALLLFALQTSHPSPVRSALGQTPMAWLGRRSYGWYLWHYPLLVLARLAVPFEISLYGQLLIAIGSLGLADITYRWVERRWHGPMAVRVGNGQLLKQSAGATIVLAVLTVGLGLHTSAWRKQLINQAVPLIDADYWNATPECAPDTTTSLPIPYCLLYPSNRGGTLIIWGDSHAFALIPTMRRIAEHEALRLLVLTKAGCPAMPLVGWPNSDKKDFHDCFAERRANLQTVRGVAKEGPTVAVLTSRWPAYVENIPLSIADRPLFSRAERAASFARRLDSISSSLEAFLSELHTMNVLPVLVEDVPEMLLPVPSCLVRRAADRCDTSRSSEEEYRRDIHMLLAQQAAKYSVPLIDPLPYLCDRDRCPGQIAGRPLYFDDDHLSHYGAEQLEAPLSAAIATALQQWPDADTPAP